MLAWVVRCSPWLMLVVCVLGVLLPRASAAVLPFLPQVLFFLMCFSLVGMNQRALLRALFSRAVWRYALLHGAGTGAALALGAWLCGARGDWLVAVAAVGVSSPLFASGALVQTVGLDALPAMARTIAATLLLPLWLLGLMLLSDKADAQVDLAGYGVKLVVYVAAPMLLAVGVRKMLPDAWLLRFYPRAAQFSVLLVFSFPFGLMAAFRDFWDAGGSGAALWVLALSTVLIVAACALAYVCYCAQGREAALLAALVGGSRNVLLTLAIGNSFLGETYLVLIGALQLPMFVMPLLARFWAVRRGYA